ncbi:MAG: phage holin family protein [Bacteroidia bacterium]|nr:phage holin family protein [Bacteroidia bacterium]
MNFILKIIISALAVFIVANILPHVTVDDYLSALMVAVVLAFLNTIVKPILTILTIPITVFTLGLFLLAINAFIIIFAEKLVSGFHVDGFWWALLFSLILSLITGILNALFGVNDKPKRDRD